MTTREIGFIGLGRMGFPMARNLAAKGHIVHVFDIATDALKRAAARGVSVRILLDAFGSRTLPRDFLSALEAAGVRHDFKGGFGAEGVHAGGKFDVHESAPRPGRSRIQPEYRRVSRASAVRAVTPGGDCNHGAKAG